MFIFMTILSLVVKLQFAGSFEPLAVDFCHRLCGPVDTFTVVPQGVIPVEGELRYTS